MQKSNTTQRRNSIINYVYATLVGMFIVACAVTISLISPVETKKIAVNDDVQVATKAYVLPVKDYTITKDYSATELQYNDTMKQWEIHKAIDFVVAEQTDVYAIADGTISKVYTNYLEGTVVEITHDNDLISVYKSLDSNVSVAVGDKVSAGQTIGVVGNTMSQELSSGKHLHFEMTSNGTKVDPNNYLALGNK